MESALEHSQRTGVKTAVPSPYRTFSENPTLLTFIFLENYVRHPGGGTNLNFLQLMGHEGRAGAADAWLFR